MSVQRITINTTGSTAVGAVSRIRLVSQATTGPTGPSGFIAQATEPAGGYLWFDTDATPTANAAAVPAGGTTGQVLAKNSSTDYDTEWIAASGVGDLLAANNLSELTATASTARTNLGLGTAATTAASAYATAAQGTLAGTAVQPARSISTTAPLTGGGDLSANRTLAVSAASTSATGVVELATSAETATGTDTERAVTPAGAAATYQPLAQAINAQVGTTYTLVAGDAGRLVTLSNSSAITLTVPQDSDATIAVGTYVDLYQLGAGQVTVAAGTGATLRVSGLTAKARAQYSRLVVQKVSANTWSLAGDLAAS
jgi:hypothetical protein